MHYKTFFSLQTFLFITLAMIFTPAVTAKGPNSLVIEAQTAGAQMSGVDISLVDDSGGKVLTSRTDEKGSFTFSNVGPGSYKLRIGCAGAGARSGDVSGGAGVQKCYAEFHIKITDESRGVITGAIRKEGS